MNVDTPGNEFGKGTLSSEITYLGKIRYLVLCRVACVVVPTTKRVKICRAQKRIKITYAACTLGPRTWNFFRL